MTHTRTTYLIAQSLLVLLAWQVGCTQDDPDTKAKVPVNSFSMQVNQQVWTPFQAENNPCTGSTYSGHFALLGDMPFYTIYAYRDPTGRADAGSENLLRIRIMNVVQPGAYILDGTYKEDFDSFIIFALKQPNGSSKRYVNDSGRSPFVVHVQELFPMQYSDTKGIKGIFSGIVYNEADPSDSLTIEDGEFTFKILSYYNHCEL